MTALFVLGIMVVTWGGVMDKSSRGLRRLLVEQFNVEHKCVACGTIEKLTIDRIYPKYCGGLDHIFNMQIMCWDHNQNKGSYIDYSYEYVEVAYINVSFLGRIVRDNTHLSRNYINRIVKNCIGSEVYTDMLCISMRDYDYFVEFMRLYGIKIKSKPIMEVIPKSNTKFLSELRLNYVISKEAILNYFIVE